MKVSDSKDLKDKILETACRIFAEKGYENTTIRDICKEAGAYQISINYYFGSKENLYREVLLTTFNYTEESRLEERLQHLSPEEQIREIVRTRLSSIFRDDEKSLYFKIISREYTNSKCLIREVIMQVFTPHMEYIESVFANYIGKGVTQSQCQYCAFALVSQIIVIAQHPEGRKRSWGSVLPTEAQFKELEKQMSDFIIAGANQMKMSLLSEKENIK